MSLGSTQSREVVIYLITMGNNHILKVRIIVGSAIFIIFLSLYLSTLAPTLSWGYRGIAVDGGELLAAANTLGIPHPPGYPTYTIILKIFGTIIPFGDFAYRGNLLSALLASLSVLTVYCLILRFCHLLRPEAPLWIRVSSSVFGAAVFGVSPIFWSQAVITEVYTLNAFFCSSLLLIASYLVLPQHLESKSGQTIKIFIIIFGLLVGVGLGNHLTLLAIAAPMLFWVLISNGWRVAFSPWFILAFIIGVSVYAYIPIRATQNPPVNWGDASTLQGFFWVLTADPYRDYVFGVDSGHFLSRLYFFVEMVFSQFNPLGIFFGLMGAIALWGKARSFLLAAIFTVCVISIYSFTYNSVDFQVLMIPAFLVFSVWVGIGLFWIGAGWPKATGELTLLKSLPFGSTVQILVLIVLGFLLVPVTTIIFNYGSQNLRNDRDAFEYASHTLSAVPDGSIIVTQGEKSVFSLWYMGYVEMPEKDVTIIASQLLQFDWYVRGIRASFPERVPSIGEGEDPLSRIVEHNRSNRPVFLTFRYRLLPESFELHRAGNLYEVKLK